ncbi:MAG: hypothetical protein Q3976_08620 [Corynebacterium sp.]|nr:hypothetical protein [Corynebacterium sp.]
MVTWWMEIPVLGQPGAAFDDLDSSNPMTDYGMRQFFNGAGVSINQY